MRHSTYDLLKAVEKKLAVKLGLDPRLDFGVQLHRIEARGRPFPSDPLFEEWRGIVAHARAQEGGDF